METLGSLWDRVRHPERAFQERAREAPPLGEAVGGMLLLRAPLTFVGLVLGYLSFAAIYARLSTPDSDIWRFILQRLPETMDPGELNAALAGLPVAPSLYQMLPWLAMLAPLAVLSLWLHDATFDHLALWVLGGLGARRGFRASLIADAEALKVGAFGAALGLLGDVPLAGLAFSVLLLPVAVYFWILRGFALAAWHGCPPWKGVVATLLHVVLVLLWMGLLVLACILILVLML
jgi:hypothetical protein